MISFIVYGEPYGKKDLKPVIFNGHARAYCPKENNMYMDRVISVINESFTFNEQYIFPKEKGVKIKIVAYFKVSDTHYKYYKRDNAYHYDKEGQDMLDNKIRPTKKPDCDNISKVICDAITHQGRIWHDDSQVVELSVRKLYSESPRVEVEIYEI